MKKSRITNEARKAVYRRDGYQCAVCGDNRHLQIHHIWKRSQGGGDEQMNLITLCSVCHALAHGINLAGIEFSKADVEQAMIEYMADYYTDLGVQWPTGQPLAEFTLEEWEQSFLEEEGVGAGPLPGLAVFIDGPEWFDSPEADAIGKYLASFGRADEGGDAE